MFLIKYHINWKLSSLRTKLNASYIKHIRRGKTCSYKTIFTYKFRFQFKKYTINIYIYILENPFWNKSLILLYCSMTSNEDLSSRHWLFSPLTHIFFFDVLHISAWPYVTMASDMKLYLKQGCVIKFFQADKKMQSLIYVWSVINVYGEQRVDVNTTGRC